LLRPEEHQRNDEEPYSPKDLSAKIQGTAPTSGQNARNRLEAANPKTTHYTGGLASPLSNTLASEATGGEGEGSRRKEGNSQSYIGERERGGGSDVETEEV
jgi:hypothetical protein